MQLWWLIAIHVAAWLSTAISSNLLSASLACYLAWTGETKSTKCSEWEWNPQPDSIKACLRQLTEKYEAQSWGAWSCLLVGIANSSDAEWWAQCLCPVRCTWWSKTHETESNVRELLLKKPCRVKLVPQFSDSVSIEQLLSFYPICLILESRLKGSIWVNLWNHTIVLIACCPGSFVLTFWGIAWDPCSLDFRRKGKQGERWEIFILVCHHSTPILDLPKRMVEGSSTDVQLLLRALVLRAPVSCGQRSG